ncbi:LysR family transcriptional regulator, partial [Escherichia sp. TWPC-MK]
MEECQRRGEWDKTGDILAEAALGLQPTVSRELARFEKVIGLKLFERVRGRLHPTVQGLRLFEEVQRSWYGLDRIVSAAESLREFRQGELSIACLPVFSQSFLPPADDPEVTHTLHLKRVIRYVLF